jgi:hypothetical protein
MELSGNLWERVVTLGNATGRTFSGANGNGTLTSGGASDVSGWPAAAGTGWKGGSWLNTTTNSATTSDRAQAANIDNTRSSDAGGRGVRTISSGIVTDGLVLWLDAGNTPSYPGTGTAWTDLSGNNNNGTLTNGPTYSSANGGSLVFDGVDDYVTVPYNSNFADFGTNDFTVENWVNITNTTKNYQVVCGTHVGGVGASGFYFYGRNALQSPLANSQSFGYNTDRQNNQTVASNTWIHMVVRRTSGTLTWYQNAVQGASVAFTDNINTGSSFLVGNLNAGSGFPGLYALGGKISIVRIYKKGLTAAEVAQNFNALKARFGL